MSKTIYPRKCVDCLHSRPLYSNSLELRCFHPSVTAQEIQELAQSGGTGINTMHERDGDGWFLWKRPCGLRGALWEPKA